MVLCKYKLTTFGETKRLIGIDENLAEPILFTEKLYVFDENGKRIGRFSLNVDREDGELGERKILYVHISNKAFINGRLSESIVTGTVTTKLKTLEEIRYESTQVSTSGKHERCTFLLRQKTKYYISVTNSICDVKSQTRLTIPFVDALGMIGESANAILLRHLARKGYEGILCLRTLLSNGKRCQNYYNEAKVTEVFSKTPTHLSWKRIQNEKVMTTLKRERLEQLQRELEVTKLSEQAVNGTKMQVLIVYRNITNHKKCNVAMTMALTRAGQLIYVFWSNSKCFLHVDPDAEIPPNHFAYGEAKLERRWHKDIQLHSLYLDRVDYKKIVHRSYKYQNEPLKRILGDFLEYLTLAKPEDPICFAVQYFTAFAHNAFRTCSVKQFTEEVFGEYELHEESGEWFRSSEYSYTGEFGLFWPQEYTGME